MRGNKEKKGQVVRRPRRAVVAPEATATRPAKAILADIAMKVSFEPEVRHDQRPGRLESIGSSPSIPEI